MSRSVFRVVVWLTIVALLGVPGGAAAAANVRTVALSGQPAPWNVQRRDLRRFYGPIVGCRWRSGLLGSPYRKRRKQLEQRRYLVQGSGSLELAGALA